MEVDEGNVVTENGVLGAAAASSSMSVVTEGNVMATTGTPASVTVSLHPLVIMNISEHWTRTRAQNDGKAGIVLGAIIGQHKGRHLEIMNSFELVYTTSENLVVIDRDYYRTKEEQFKQVFSELDFLGWYTTGDSPSSADIHVHKQICEINESPLFVKLNPSARNSDLPITLYESVIDLVNGEPTMLFVQLPYVLATEEAERIGVDHVARVSTADSLENSHVAEHLTAQHSAIKMLHMRVRLILEYVKAAQKGEVPICHDAIRLAFSLCHRLPVMQPERFQADFYEQCNDVTLITYLGMITKGCEEANQFITRFNMLHEKHAVTRHEKRIRLDTRKSGVGASGSGHRSFFQSLGAPVKQTLSAAVGAAVASVRARGSTRREPTSSQPRGSTTIQHNGGSVITTYVGDNVYQPLVPPDGNLRDLEDQDEHEEDFIGPLDASPS